MPRKKESQQNSELVRPPFLTIDDAIQEAERLTAILRELGEQKYPLDIRRGVARKQEETIELTAEDNDVVLKAGAKSYVFDIKQARNGTAYLAISEKRGGGKERGVIYVFAEHARAFSQAVSQMTMRLG
jgi:hypothetical protein